MYLCTSLISSPFSQRKLSSFLSRINSVICAVYTTYFFFCLLRDYAIRYIPFLLFPESLIFVCHISIFKSLILKREIQPNKTLFMDMCLWHHSLNPSLRSQAVRKRSLYVHSFPFDLFSLACTCSLVICFYLI